MQQGLVLMNPAHRPTPTGDSQGRILHRPATRSLLSAARSRTTLKGQAVALPRTRREYPRRLRKVQSNGCERTAAADRAVAERRGEVFWLEWSRRE